MLKLFRCETEFQFTFATNEWHVALHPHVFRFVLYFLTSNTSYIPLSYILYLAFFCSIVNLAPCLTPSRDVSQHRMAASSARFCFPLPHSTLQLSASISLFPLYSLKVEVVTFVFVWIYGRKNENTSKWNSKSQGKTPLLLSLGLKFVTHGSSNSSVSAVTLVGRRTIFSQPCD